MSKPQLSKLVVIAALLAGCGGGGDTPSVASSDREGRADVVTASACEGLVTLSLPGATITVAETITSGVWTLADGTRYAGLPVFCRVEGVSRPVPGSEIGFEVWVPRDPAWNGKYMQVGMIAYGGAYEYRAMAGAMQRGYATAATDGGHKGSTANASWALNQPVKIVDWGWRAHKQTGDHAKAIVQAHSGRAPARSYFYGASSGGHDALMMAQRHPQDFDGYIVDGPAVHWTRLAASWLWSVQALFTDPASWIPHAKLPAIQAAVLAQCDALDGLADGIVGDPRRCHFDVSVLQCAGVETPSCLTPKQTNALRKLHTGAISPSTGQRIFSGYELGAATDRNFISYIVGYESAVPASGQAILGNTFYANLVNDTGDAAYDFRAFDVDRDVALAEAKQVGNESLPSAINAMNPDLSGVRSRGAKIIMYTGWEDPIVPARGVIDYYERVIAAQPGGGKVALERTREYFRFFLAPGMSHLAGGTGPDGTGSPYGQPALRDDRVHDVFRALEAWVEQGIAPDRIVATKYVNDTPALGAARTRPLCPYPKLARYSGAGSPDDAASFTCVDGPRGAYLN